MSVPQALLDAWGQDVPADVLGPALAAAGILVAAWNEDGPPAPTSAEGRSPDDVLLTELEAVVTRGLDPLPWLPPFSDQPPLSVDGALGTQAGAETWATAWQRVALPSPVRLAVAPGTTNRGWDDLPWLLDLLAGPDVAPTASAFVDTATTEPPRWDWPITIGLPDAPLGNELTEALEEASQELSWLGTVTRTIRLGTSRHSAEMFVVPGAVTAWSPWLRQHRPTAEIALALVPDAGQLEAAVATLAHVGNHPIVAAAVASPTGAIDVLVAVLEQLTHDVPFDLAVGRAAAAGEGPMSYVRGPARTIERIRLRQSLMARIHDLAGIGRMLAAPEDAPGTGGDAAGGDGVGADGEIDLGEVAPPRTEGPMGPREARRMTPITMTSAPQPRARTTTGEVNDLVWRLERLPSMPEFTAESEAAMPLAEASEESREAREDHGPLRFVHADVAPAGADDDLRAFITGHDHRVTVFVGPPDNTALQGEVAFPEDELPPGQAHELTVVLSSDQLDLVESRRITLPQVGRSSTAEFEVTLDADLEIDRLDLRIAVLHGGRVLQSWMLSGPVWPGAEAVTDPDGELQLRLEAAPRLRMTDLHRRRRFDLAVIANHDLSHQPGGVAVSSDGAHRLDLSRAGGTATGTVDGVRKVIEDRLKRDRPSGINDEAMVSFLAALANRSVEFREAVEREPDALTDDSETLHLQLVTATPDAWLPLELAYSFAAPGLNAVLCQEGAELLSDPTPSACPGQHGEGVVCPLGFWGLRHVIERRIHDDGGIEAEGWSEHSEPSDGRNRITLRGPVLFGASERVDQVDAMTSAEAIRAIGGDDPEIRDQRITVADSWVTWTDGVSTAPHPDVLALLPHTFVHDELGDAVEISTDVMGRTMISGKHIRAEQAAEDHRVIALLLGCRTDDADVPLSTYTARFRRRGATFVVGTVAKVQGRDAGPLAAAIVSQLLDRSRPPTSLGELFVGLRRAAVRDLGPIGLVLVAYGDADWIVGAEEES